MPTPKYPTYDELLKRQSESAPKYPTYDDLLGPSKQTTIASLPPFLDSNAPSPDQYPAAMAVLKGMFPEPSPPPPTQEMLEADAAERGITVPSDYAREMGAAPSYEPPPPFVAPTRDDVALAKQRLFVQEAVKTNPELAARMLGLVHGPADAPEMRQGTPAERAAVAASPILDAATRLPRAIAAKATGRPFTPPSEERALPPPESAGQAAREAAMRTGANVLAPFASPEGLVGGGLGGAVTKAVGAGRFVGNLTGYVTATEAAEAAARGESVGDTLKTSALAVPKFIADVANVAPELARVVEDRLRTGEWTVDQVERASQASQPLAMLAAMVAMPRMLKPNLRRIPMDWETRRSGPVREGPRPALQVPPEATDAQGMVPEGQGATPGLVINRPGGEYVPRGTEFPPFVQPKGQPNVQSGVRPADQGGTVAGGVPVAGASRAVAAGMGPVVDAQGAPAGGQPGDVAVRPRVAAGRERAGGGLENAPNSRSITLVIPSAVKQPPQVREAVAPQKAVAPPPALPAESQTDPASVTPEPVAAPVKAAATVQESVHEEGQGKGTQAPLLSEAGVRESNAVPPAKAPRPTPAGTYEYRPTIENRGRSLTPIVVRNTSDPSGSGFKTALQVELERLGGKWVNKDRGYVFPESKRAAVEKVISDATQPKEQPHVQETPTAPAFPPAAKAKRGKPAAAVQRDQVPPGQGAGDAGGEVVAPSTEGIGSLRAKLAKAGWPPNDVEYRVDEIQSPEELAKTFPNPSGDIIDRYAHAYYADKIEEARLDREFNNGPPSNEPKTLPPFVPSAGLGLSDAERAVIREQVNKPGTIDTGTRVDVRDADIGESGAFDPTALARGAKGVGSALVGGVNALLGEMTFPLRKIAAGRGLTVALDDISTKTATLRGQIENDVVDVGGKLTRADRKWLDSVDPLGYPNEQRMIEDTPSGRITAPNPRIDAWRTNVYEKAREITGKEAERVGVKVRAHGNIIRDFGMATTGRFLRVPTGDMFEAMHRRSGPTWDAIVAMVVRDNPNIKSLKEAASALDEWLGPESVRKQGSIERARTIHNFAAYVKVGNSWVQILDTDPIRGPRGMVDHLGRRIYFIEHFGQSIVEPVKIQTMARFAKVMGAKVPFGSARDVIKSAIAAKIQSPPKFGPRRTAALQKLADRIGLVDKRKAPADLAADLFTQLDRVADNYVERLRARHQKEGGNTGDFDDAISVFFNRPYGQVFLDPRHPGKRVARAIDAIIGLEQTSLSAIPNLPQVFVQVPRMAGMTNFLGSLSDAIGSPRMTASQLAAAGAMNRSVVDWTIRKGYRLEDSVRIAKDIGGRVFMLHWIAEFNNMVAGAAGARLARSWAWHGAQEADHAIANELLLRPAEWADAMRGSISPELRNKIIQNMVKKTQYVTEDPHRRSKFQNVPILQTIFSYQNYAIGTAKSSMRIAQDVVSSYASGDPKRMSASTRRLAVFLAGAMGAGMASIMLRRKLYGQPVKRNDETWVGLMGKALAEAALLGPTLRMIDAFSRTHSGTEMLLDASPKLKYVGELLYSFKPQGETSLGDRLTKFFTKHTPALRAARNAMGLPPPWWATSPVTKGIPYNPATAAWMDAKDAARPALAALEKAKEAQARLNKSPSAGFDRSGLKSALRDSLDSAGLTHAQMLAIRDDPAIKAKLSAIRKNEENMRKNAEMAKNATAPFIAAAATKRLNDEASKNAELYGKVREMIEGHKAKKAG